MLAKCLEIPCFCWYQGEVSPLKADEASSDEARHGKAFEGLLKRYFGK